VVRRGGTPAAAGADPAGSGQAPRIFLYPLSEKFIWREWAVPFALAAVVASIVIARAVFTPAPIQLEAPATAVLAPLARQAEAPADPPPAAGQPTEEAVATPGVRVLLRCEGTTWAEATPDGGPQRRYELGPGQNLALTARERLSLSLGDAGVIQLRVNERELGFIGDKGEIKIGLSFTAPKQLPAAVPAAAAGD
jgi:hypothetical protein